jgi:DNA-binding HxlR family transcriptional regulator
LNELLASQDNDKKRDVYDKEIDKFVINTLSETAPLWYEELKNRIEQQLMRKISPTTFSKHLAMLADKGLIKKVPHGVGKETHYSLTELALKKVGLGLLGNDIEEINLFRRVYGIIFFYDIFCLPKVTTSEKEFEQLLADINLDKNDLNWGRITFPENSDAADLAYGVGSNHTFFDGRYLQTFYEFWKDRDGSPVLIDIKHICHPNPKLGIDFEIERIDYWQINKKFPIYNYLKEWYLYLPGFSSADILLTHPDLDSDVLTDALNRLAKMGLIKEFIPVLDGDRFRISDDSLRNLLASIWTIHKNGEFDRLIDKWSLFEQSTDDEVERMKILLGNDEAERIFKIVNLKRSKFNVFRRKCKLAKDLHNYIIWEWTPKVAIPVIGNQYPMPDSDDLKLLYKISDEFQEIVFTQKLERYRNMKKSGKISYKKRIKNEAEEYFEFLKEGFYRELRYLPFSADDTIEDVKVTLKDTIINYAFLEDIIRDICPKILEPIDDEVQKEMEEVEFQSKIGAHMTDLIYIIKQKVNGRMTIRELRDSSEIREFQTRLKIGTAFYYDSQETFNSITHRIEHRKIYHLLNQKELESGKFTNVHIIQRVYNPITQKMEELPVIHILDTNENRRTTKNKKSKFKGQS